MGICALAGSCCLAHGAPAASSTTQLPFRLHGNQLDPGKAPLPTARGGQLESPGTRCRVMALPAHHSSSTSSLLEEHPHSPKSAAAEQEKPHLVSAEEGARLGTADLAHGVLQVWVNLNLKQENQAVGMKQCWGHPISSQHPSQLPPWAGSVGHSAPRPSTHPTDAPSAPLTFLVNLVVLISMNAAVTAFR